MAQYAASPLFVPGLCNMAYDNLLESGVEERFNNACFGRGPDDAFYEQPVSWLKLEEDHYVAQPLLWAPVRSSECSEASHAFFLTDRNPCSRHELSCDARDTEMLRFADLLNTDEELDPDMEAFCKTAANSAMAPLLPAWTPRTAAALDAPVGLVVKQEPAETFTQTSSFISSTTYMAALATSRRTTSIRLMPGRSKVMVGRQVASAPVLKNEGLTTSMGMIPNKSHNEHMLTGARKLLRSAGSSQDCYSADDAALLDEMMTEDFTLSVPVPSSTCFAGGMKCDTPAEESDYEAPRQSGSKVSKPAAQRKAAAAAAASKRTGRRTGEYAHITQDMLKDGGFFDMPIQEAASLLGIGLSVLKRVCRTIGLARWPYRKRQSLRNVIEQTKLYLKDMDFSAKANVLGLLEEAAAALDGSAGEDLGDAFKRYRQAVFKLNYKINKLNSGKKCGLKASLGKSKVAIPKSAAASLEAMINYQLPEGGSPRATLADPSLGRGCGPIGMGDKKLSSFGGAMGLNLGSLAAPCVTIPAPTFLDDEEEDDPRSLLITDLPGFQF